MYNAMLCSACVLPFTSSIPYNSILCSVEDSESGTISDTTGTVVLDPKLFSSSQSCGTSLKTHPKTNLELIFKKKGKYKKTHWGTDGELIRTVAYCPCGHVAGAILGHF